LAQVLVIVVSTDTMGQTPKAVDEVRGPARFFYDKSTYPASYALAQEVKRAAPGACGADHGFAGEAVDVAARKEKSASSPPKIARTEARCCVMCDHCWRAKRSTRRSDVVKCPECLSNQPGDLTEAELEEMEEKYKEFQKELEKTRRSLMAAASHERAAAQKRGE